MKPGRYGQALLALLEVVHGRHVVVVALGGSTTLVGLGNLLEVGEVVRAKLVDDTGKELLEILGLGGTTDDVGVGGDGRLHFRLGEVNDLAVLLEEVDLLDGRDVGDTELLEGRRKLLVIGGGSLVDGLLLATDSALASCTDSAELGSQLGTSISNIVSHDD